MLMRQFRGGSAWRIGFRKAHIMKSNQVFVLVRNAEGDEFENVDVFQSVHRTRGSAERTKASLEHDFGLDYEILERTIENN